MKLYKWTDDSGQVRYGDTPPVGRKHEVQEIRTPSADAHNNQNNSTREPNNLEPASSASQAAQTPEDLQQAIQDVAKVAPIILYSIPNCESCDLMRLYLERADLPFTELDVKDNATAQKQLMAKTGELRLPFLTIGESKLGTYSREALHGLLTQHGYQVNAATTQ